MNQIKHIEVAPYNPDWPQQFEEQKIIITQALGKNCLAAHHIGSTSVPKLSAKPTIDVIVEVKNGSAAILPLEKAGFVYRVEWNIPLRYCFTKRTEVKVNLHLFEEGHPEIELNLIFRDYLRSHKEERERYDLLKRRLLEDKTSFVKESGSMFANYTIRKGEFIRSVLRKTDFKRLRMLKCTDEMEIARAKEFRQKYFFTPHGIDDPYTWTFNHPDHTHLILYQGVEIIGYAHLQLWADRRAAIRIIVVEETKRNNNFGGQFLHLCEKWLQVNSYKSLHTESSPAAVGFYRKNGYIPMPFNDPDGYKSDPSDIPLGKVLIEGDI